MPAGKRMWAPKPKKGFYEGVYYREGTIPGTSTPARTYYIVYRNAEGRKVEEKVGTSYRLYEDEEGRKHKMSPALASQIRALRISGKELSNEERRAQERARKAAEQGAWTFDRLWKAWKEDPENAGKGGTLKTDYRYKKHIGPVLGPREPKDLIREDLDRLRHKLAERYAKETTRSVLSLVHRVANYGFIKGYCPGLQFPIVLKKKKLGKEPRSKRTFTSEEAAAYRKACREWPDPQVGGFVLLISYTGWRLSSARKLKWKDVHLDADPPMVVLCGTKSGDDIPIQLSDDAVTLLRAHPRDPDNPFVFQGKGEKGDLNDRQAKVTPGEIMAVAGIHDKMLDPLHAWRRWVATQLDKQGASTNTIMRVGGWKSPAMPLAYTAHTKTTIRDAVNSLARILREADEAAEEREAKGKTA